jgi:hypothetical protein
VAWLPPELDVGADPALKPLLELELEPESELEPELESESEPVEVEALEPVELEPDPEEDVLVLCVEPGRPKARAPAATTLAIVTAVVVDRTLVRPRSLAATAWRIPSSRRSLLMSFSMRSRNRESLHEPSA